MIHTFIFEPPFAKLVETGAKLQTVRGLRPLMPVPGDKLELFGRMPNGDVRILHDGHMICQSVQPIRIYRHGDWTRVELDGELLVLVQIRDLALADGFANTVDLLRFFERLYRLPFAGMLVTWKSVEQGAGK